MIFSRNLRLIVLELEEIEHAEQPERDSGLYQWARLFKAQTWEELKDMAEQNETIAKAVMTLKTLSEDDKIRLQCEARDRYEHDKASFIADGKRLGGIETLILDNLEEGKSREQILAKIMRYFSLSPEAAERYFNQFANSKDL
ncbi:MAG: PD-(D/E)XK nuclease family transposase [Lachnospiraceae bacterium]|nr:PD-(D/E)XK nuclease family transposase [Lachnospiraceae bacterium]